MFTVTFKALWNQGVELDGGSAALAANDRILNLMVVNSIYNIADAICEKVKKKNVIGFGSTAIFLYTFAL